jgi:hypothetical protein
LNLRWPYHASVMNTFEIVSNATVCIGRTPPYAPRNVGILSLEFSRRERK